MRKAGQSSSNSLSPMETPGCEDRVGVSVQICEYHNPLILVYQFISISTDMEYRGRQYRQIAIRCEHCSCDLPKVGSQYMFEIPTTMPDMTSTLICRHMCRICSVLLCAM